MSKADLHDVMEALPSKDKRTPMLAERMDISELPDGRKVSDLSRQELAKALAKLKIKGASPQNTAEANVALYERHLQRMFDDAGSDAIVAFLFGDHEDKDEDKRDED